MRLDFSWSQALSEETKSEIEEVSNLAISADLAVSAQFMTVGEAKDFGAIALFGETYDEQVRVVQVGGPWSRELCGGTHVSRSSQIGLVSVTTESSVGSGSRRIEALVGQPGLHALHADRDIVKRLSAELKSSPEELESKVTQALSDLKAAEKKLQELEAGQVLSKVPELAKQAKAVGSYNLLSLEVSIESSDMLRSLAMALRSELGEDSVVILGSKASGSAVVVAVAGKDAVAAGAKAGQLVSVASKILGGGGGGKPDMAQGGGSDSDKLTQALSAAAASI
jgi:alanyl-tRNA synthetase